MSESMEKFFASQDRLNAEQLAKYKRGQRVAVDLEGSVENATIEDIFLDYNGGPIQAVFVDLLMDDGSVEDRILADHITGIISDPEEVTPAEEKEAADTEPAYPGKDHPSEPIDFNEGDVPF